MAKLEITQGIVLSVATGSGQSTYRSESGGYNSRTSFGPNIHYQYTVNGQQYTNNAYSQRPFLINNQAIVQNILNNYPVDSNVTIYYNPDNPQESYLQKGYGGAVNLILIGTVVLVLLVVAIALVIVFSTGV